MKPSATVSKDEKIPSPTLGTFDVVHSPSSLLRRAHFREGWIVLFLVGLAALLLLARLPCGLLEPEEARYAEIARQMLEQDRWLTPVWHGEDYLHKPPLFYWLLMISYRVFGVSDWAARLAPCLAGVGVVAAVYLWARATLGRRNAVLGCLILLLSSRFLYLQGMVLFDGLLTLWVTLAWTFGTLAYRAPRFSWPCWLTSALSCSLGILTKGPVALALIGPPLLFVFLSRSRARGPGVLQLGIAYALVAGVVCTPWFLYLAVEHPEAARDFFLLHHLQRYVDPFDHAKPWWFYLGPLFLGMLPGSLILWPTLRTAFARLGPRWKARTESPSSVWSFCNGRFLLRSRPGVFWVAGIWCVLFFSLSGCKRPAYILPAFAPLAGALGYHMGRIPWLRDPTGFLGLARSGGMLATFTACVLLVGTLVWLPAYHARFGMRDALASVRETPDLPIYCYPRCWDSVSFYKAQNLHHFDEPDALFAALSREQACWLIVRRRDGLTELTGRWPTSVQIIEQTPFHSNIVVLRATHDGAFRRSEKP